MSDDDELRLRAHRSDHIREAPDVGFVQRRVHFVQNAERAGLIFENGDEQSERGKSLFASAEQLDILQTLARRLRGNVNARVAGAVYFRQAHFAGAAAEERAEGFRKIRVDCGEGLLESLA